jgi:subtilisin family serine protease
LDETSPRYRSPIVGDLLLPPPGAAASREPTVDPNAPVAMLIELNVRYPGGLPAARQAFHALWERFARRARTSGASPERSPAVDAGVPETPDGLAYVAPKLYQCVLSRAVVRELVTVDQRPAGRGGPPPTIFRVWPDYTLEPQIDRSAPTVKADAAWRSYSAHGAGIVWAVIDSGIDACHPHFSALEIAKERRGDAVPDGATSALHRDFSYLVDPANPDQPLVPAAEQQLEDAPAATEAGGVPPVPAAPTALVDESGHGTHVAGIIAGCTPDRSDPRVAISAEATNGGFVPRKRHGILSGMAPACELVSLKVMRRTRQGTWVTSSAAVIRALTYLRMEVNVDPAVLRVHGVNLSLGARWHPDQYAAGQSPLCQAVNQLVAAGVVVVISTGNDGARAAGDGAASPSAVLGSITEPAHAQDCIAVGSTHRDAPHAFGVTWTSGKGPTLDGRMKPDVVAPGEWICSAVAGELRARAGLDPADPLPTGERARRNQLLTYAEDSGTSMAAPHVSGVIAAFLSARPEFIGRPQQVKKLLTDTATDLGRERYAQGAGLVDLMRMLANV